MPGISESYILIVILETPRLDFRDRHLIYIWHIWQDAGHNMYIQSDESRGAASWLLRDRRPIHKGHVCQDAAYGMVSRITLIHTLTKELIYFQFHINARKKRQATAVQICRTAASYSASTQQFSSSTFKQHQEIRILLASTGQQF